MTTTTRALVMLGLLGATVASTPLVAPDAAAAPPASIRMQGSLTDHSGGDATPANGTYAMTFSLYPALAGGSPVATVGPLNVPVQNGLYNADVPFPPSVFDGTSLFLEVGINGEILAPRIPIVSVPYAYQAGQAVTVAPGSVGTEGLAPGAVTADKLGIPCGEGQILIRRNGAWTCGSFVCVPGTPRDCPYSGPPVTVGVGVCHPPVQVCDLGGTGFGPCSGEVVPSTEVCDNLDNDCDGTVDDNCAICGNGAVEPTETCDDGGTNPGDGCGATCQVEQGWSCTGQPSVCSFICSAGFSNCDGDPANGCECQTTVCCAGACAPQHSNGLGQTYEACEAPGTPGNAATYTQAMAIAARDAWPVSGSALTGFCSGSQSAVMRQGVSSCATWVYTGALAGYVHLNTLNSSCICPAATDPTWD